MLRGERDGIAQSVSLLVNRRHGPCRRESSETAEKFLHSGLSTGLYRGPIESENGEGAGDLVERTGGEVASALFLRSASITSVSI